MLGHFLGTLNGHITRISHCEVCSEGRVRQNVHMQLSWTVRKVTLASKLTALLVYTYTISF